MSGMPLARIYASSVEESEPLRADFLARGYNVEVVFPDAEPSGSADLELRLEHCSPAQAVARVEANSGSPSRCVFLTPAKGPQHDILLIEMTVAATGTHSRHPLYLPVNLRGANLVAVPHVEAPQVAAPQVAAPLAEQADQQAPAKAVVLPFPENLPVLASFVPLPAVDDLTDPTASNKNDNWNKLVGAEVTAFLAHAPQLEPESLAGIFSGIGRSRIATRVRIPRLGLSLFGVAASVLLLFYAGWHASSTHPRQSPGTVQAAVSAPSSAVQPQTPVHLQYVKSTRRALAPAAHDALVRQAQVRTTKVRTTKLRTTTLRTTLHTTKLRTSNSRPVSHFNRAEDLVAADTVVRVRPEARRVSIPRPAPADGKFLISSTANPTKPVGMSSPPPRPAQNRQVPIKKITDLK